MIYKILRKLLLFYRMKSLLNYCIVVLVAKRLNSTKTYRKHLLSLYFITRLGVFYGGLYIAY